MRRSFAGHSLVEVLLASAMLTLVMVVVLTALVTGQRSQSRQSETEKGVRACMLTVEHLRKHLRVATVELVEPSSIRYRVLTRDAQGQVELGPSGEPIWSETYTVSLQGSRVVRDHLGQSRQLAELGPGGRFDLVQEQLNLIRVEVHSGFGGGHSLRTRLHLNNQF